MKYKIITLCTILIIVMISISACNMDITSKINGVLNNNTEESLENLMESTNNTSTEINTEVQTEKVTQLQTEKPTEKPTEKQIDFDALKEFITSETWHGYFEMDGNNYMFEFLFYDNGECEIREGRVNSEYFNCEYGRYKFEDENRIRLKLTRDDTGYNYTEDDKNVYINITERDGKEMQWDLSGGQMDGITMSVVAFNGYE